MEQLISSGMFQQLEGRFVYMKSPTHYSAILPFALRKDKWLHDVMHVRENLVGCFQKQFFVCAITKGESRIFSHSPAIELTIISRRDIFRFKVLSFFFSRAGRGASSSVAPATASPPPTSTGQSQQLTPARPQPETTSQ